MTLVVNRARPVQRVYPVDPEVYWVDQIGIADFHERRLRMALIDALAPPDRERRWELARRIARGDSAPYEPHLALRRAHEATAHALTAHLSALVDDVDPAPRQFARTREIASWARRHALAHANDLSAQQQRALASIIASGVSARASAEEIADALFDSIGLHERYAIAVNNLRNDLIRRGMSRSAAGTRARAYAERLRHSRALTIARTETMRALNAAQLNAWARDKTTERVTWVVTIDDRLCAACATMRGKSVKVGEQFVTPYGPVSAPPMHVNCRCVLRASDA